MSNATATWALRPDVVATVVEDGAVLLDLESKYFYSVNATGWAMLRLFEAGATREHAEERCKGWGTALLARLSISRRARTDFEAI